MRARARDERGAILALLAIGLVVLLGMAGLVLDSGRAYLVKARLSRAVDAGALAGARARRAGVPAARREAIAVARANGVEEERNETRVQVQFGQNEIGESTVTVTARRVMPTTFMRVLGPRALPIASSATAAVPPIDLVLVIDQSSSLREAGAWEDLQDAARRFVDYFDQDLDRMALVSYSTRGTTRVPLEAGFGSDVRRAIDAMRSQGFTNMAEGLRLAEDQITDRDVRERSAKVVVFFTDGLPTAFRGPIGGRDRIMAASFRPEKPEAVWGYYDQPEEVPPDRYVAPDACIDVNVCPAWTEAESTPHGPLARAFAHDLAVAEAQRLGSSGAYVYTIGLGNPTADERSQPDLDFLELLANVEGARDGRQPAGRSYFAPSSAELRQVFDRVASDLIIRLAR
jgi:Mg-chelatase subunit ChlD